MSSAETLTLEWILSPIQTKYFQSPAKYRTLVAGRRFGKNKVGLASQVDYANNPTKYEHGQDDPTKVVTWWVAPSYTQAKKYGFEEAKDMIPDALIDGSPKASPPYEIPLTNGAKMEFYSYGNPESLDGAGVDDMVIDERGYMPDSVWDTNLAPMLLDTGGRASFIGKPWPSEHFEDCFRKGLNDEIDRYESWHATSYDNPWIPDQRIDELFGDLPEQIYNREIMAEFDATGSLLTKDMLQFTHTNDMPDREYKYQLGVDLGVEKDAEKARENDTDYFAAALYAVDRMDQTAYIVDVHRDRGMSLRQGIEWLDEITRPLRPVRPEIFIEANQAQDFFVQEASNQGLNVAPVKTTTKKEDRLVQLSIPFENGSIQLVNRDVDVNLGYDSRWKDFVSEWLAFPSGGHDDMLDAVEIGAQSIAFTEASLLGASRGGVEA